jgi:hypothetical protein
MCICNANRAPCCVLLQRLNVTGIFLILIYTLDVKNKNFCTPHTKWCADCRAGEEMDGQHGTECLYAPHLIRSCPTYYELKHYSIYSADAVVILVWAKYSLGIKIRMWTVVAIKGSLGRGDDVSSAVYRTVSCTVHAGMHGPIRSWKLPLRCKLH